MTGSQALGSLPPAVVTAGATWLLHKRGGLPVWQALTAVLLGLAFGPGGPGDQLAAAAAQAAKRIAAETARRRIPQQGRRQAWDAAVKAVLAVAGSGLALAVPAIRAACGTPVPGRRYLTCLTAADESE